MFDNQAQSLPHDGPSERTMSAWTAEVPSKEPSSAATPPA